VSGGKCCVMFPIRYWGVPLLGALGLVGVTAAHAADLSLGEAIKQADKKYLDVPPLSGLGDAQEIVAGAARSKACRQSRTRSPKGPSG
jgi:hypothetical protein